MEPQIVCFAILTLCACASSALQPSSRRQELSRLINLLGKLKDLDQQRHSEVIDEVRPRDSLVINTLIGQSPTVRGVAKRQGDWFYDYGLGGGRFGKRGGVDRYGDYGIGGGRYGRDVSDMDHVDLADTVDSDMTS